MPKIIQIVIGPSALIALRDDGSVWEYERGYWKGFPPIPEAPSKPIPDAGGREVWLQACLAKGENQ